MCYQAPATGDTASALSLQRRLTNDGALWIINDYARHWFARREAGVGWMGSGELIMASAVGCRRARANGGERRVSVALLVVGLLSAAPAMAQDADPLEPINRAIFQFNRVIDGMFLEPAAIMYRGVVPAPVRRGIGNALHNLRSPIILANDMLQGDVDRAGNTLARFLVNSTVGFAGFVEVAEDLGYPRHDQDFGLTLGRWGAPAGPYLMLPVLGPSSPRDLGGMVGDFFADPLTHVGNGTGEVHVARAGLQTVDFRERNLETFDDLERTSIDLYATFRTIYRQQRAAAVAERRGEVDDGAYEDIFRDDDDFE